MHTFDAHLMCKKCQAILDDLAKHCSAGGTIKCSLTIQQTLPFDHMIWDMIEFEDTIGIKSLLTSRQVSVNAQDNGSVCAPLLHVRL